MSDCFDHAGQAFGDWENRGFYTEGYEREPRYPRRFRRSRRIEIKNATVVHETAKGILISDGDQQAWFPALYCEYIKRTGSFHYPNWLNPQWTPITNQKESDK